jgi:DNA mismatch repair protein MutS
VSTPIRQQYLQVKRQYPDTILFFRLGDFYETFDEDARLVAKELDIVLTSRPVGKDQRVPLAGVPYHAVEGYVAKLIGKGYKVAICEQVSEEPVKGLVPREVVRVVTPGTVVEPSMLDDRFNNYLASLVTDDSRAGLAYADITTGEFATTQLTDGTELRRAVGEELARLRPAECLIPQSAQEEFQGWIVNPEGAVHISPYDNWHFDYDNARRALLDHFGVASLAGYGCEGLPLAVQAAGALVQYLQDTQKSALKQLNGLATYSISEFMTLDAATRRNLELTQTIRTGSARGALLTVLDRTATAMGARMIRRWLNQPLLNLAQLQARLDTVQALYESTPARTELLGLLKGMADLERMTNRAVQRIATPRDLVGISRSLGSIPKMQEVLANVEQDESHPLRQVKNQLDPCTSVAEFIKAAIADEPPATLNTTGVIRPGFSNELDHIVTASRDAKKWVANLEREERRRTGIKTLKVGYNKVFGYYIEITKANADAVPPEYIRKQTLVNAERYITPDLKEYESLILNAQEQLLEIESRIFREVSDQIAAAALRLLATARALAELDVYISLAEVALRHRYVRPALDEEHVIAIKNGRHPVVELTLRDEPFVPNDVYLSAEEEILVITGPNMSGKSTFLRQVALIVLMAQIGSFVPADEAHIGLVDRIFTRIGAQDEISAGQSTFMVEMVETANILNHATQHSLLVLDELGRGTSTYDGISIAWAVVEHIHNHPRLRAKTLFATHYHELVDLASHLPRVRNYNVAVAEEGDRIVFLRRIVPGGADRSYGIHVAHLAGLPRPVIHRAEEILADLESGRTQTASASPLRVQQLTLFSIEDPLREELKSLDVDSMSPLEALNKLYDVCRRARQPK